MKKNYWLLIVGVCFIAGCSKGEMNSEYILEKTIEEMGRLDSYAFEIKSENKDSNDVETNIDLSGETIIEPFRAVSQSNSNDSVHLYETTAYYVEDMVYLEFEPELDQLIRYDLEDQTPDHLLKVLDEVNNRKEQLQFSEEDDVFFYEFSHEVNDDLTFSKDLYPFWITTASILPGVFDLQFDYSDINEFNLRIGIDKDDFFVKELSMEYVADYDFLETGDPFPWSEKVEISFFNHNKIEEIAMPVGEFDDSLSMMEYIAAQFAEEDNERELHIPEVIPETLGNTGSNLMNGGQWASDDEWIYYSSYGEGFYRKKKDGDEKQLLLENEVSDINVIDDWLFYIDKVNNSDVYRMRKDGSERQQITDAFAQNLVVVNDNVFVMPTVYTESGDIHILRFKTDLSDTEVILDQSNRFTVGQEHLIYQKDYNETLYFLDLNDLENEFERMFYGIRARYFAIEDGWFYYENADYNYQIFRMSLENGHNERVTNQPSEGFNVINNSVYFRNVNENRSLHRHDIEEGITQSLDDEEVHNIHIIDEYIYYLKADNVDEIQWYRIMHGDDDIERVVL
ncbi:DUF6612 family protein [Bacillus sp. JCM 19034]|uniref:DUF6612 family protein n=1 Tax=Bacillus sp. JCM 19034 TaxID=1481928 RepID=UPI0007857E45|nr:DUF6612 family protein [Bacillus sp. JCM 19034]